MYICEDQNADDMLSNKAVFDSNAFLVQVLLVYYGFYGVLNIHGCSILAALGSLLAFASAGLDTYPAVSAMTMPRGCASFQCGAQASMLSVLRG